MYPLPDWRTALAAVVNNAPVLVASAAYMADVVGPEVVTMVAVADVVVEGAGRVYHACPVLSGKCIRGVVSGAGNEVVNGLAIRYSGSAAGTITTGVGGVYASPWLPSGGNYTLQLAVPHHDVAPASVAVDNLVANRDNVNFRITRRTVDVRGTIRAAAREPVNGIKVKCSGASVGETLTLHDGSYVLRGLLEGGDYRIEPEAPAHHGLQPAHQDIAGLAPGQGAVDFTITRKKVTLTGTVGVTDGSAANDGVVIRYSGATAGTAITHDGGQFSIADLWEGGNYTIRPDAVAHYDLNQAQAIRNGIAAGQSANFTLTRRKVTVHGQVNPAGQESVDQLDIDYTGASNGSVKTEQDGSFTLADLNEGGQYRVTPRVPAFHTLDRGFENIASAAAGNIAGFTLTRQTFRVSGTVNGPADKIDGVTIWWEGEVSGSTTTNPQGEFRTDPLPAGGKYTITPDKLYCEFAPVELPVTLDQDRPRQDFTARLATYTVSGFFSEIDFNSAVPKRRCDGVTVRFHGGAVDTTIQTTGTGEFTFAAPARGSYSLEFSKSYEAHPFGFDPVSPIVFNNLPRSWSREIETWDTSWTRAGGARPPRVPKWYDALPRDTDGWANWNEANSIASGYGAHSADHLPGLVAAVNQGPFGRTDVLPRIVSYAMRTAPFRTTDISRHYEIRTLPHQNGGTINLTRPIIVVWNFVANPLVTSCGTVFPR